MGGGLCSGAGCEGGLTLAVEKLGAVLARKCDAFGDFAHELHDLCDVVVVFAVPGSRGGIEQVVAPRDELEYLCGG